MFQIYLCECGYDSWNHPKYAITKSIKLQKFFLWQAYKIQRCGDGLPSISVHSHYFLWWLIFFLSLMVFEMAIETNLWSCFWGNLRLGCELGRQNLNIVTTMSTLKKKKDKVIWRPSFISPLFFILSVMWLADPHSCHHAITFRTQSWNHETKKSFTLFSQIFFCKDNFLFVLSYVYEYFAWMYLCTPCLWLVPLGIRRGYHSPWK